MTVVPRYPYPLAQIGNLLEFYQYNVPYFTLALICIFSLCYNIY